MSQGWRPVEARWLPLSSTRGPLRRTPAWRRWRNQVQPDKRVQGCVGHLANCVSTRSSLSNALTLPTTRPG